MKNILNVSPSEGFLHRLAYSAAFVADEDIKGQKILDIGCGFGWFEEEAVKRGAKEIVGIEISEKNLSTAKKSIIKDNVVFQVAGATALPFKEGSFDTVVLWEVIEHIPKKNENKLFSEVRRMLKDNGVFYLSSPCKNTISNIFDPGWWIIGHRHYNSGDLAGYAEENHFVTEKFSIRGGWWEIFGIWNLYISKWIFRRKPFFEKFLAKKIDIEYNKKKGFNGIFCRFRAV